MAPETVPPRAKKRRPRSPSRAAAAPPEETTGPISPPPATAVEAPALEPLGSGEDESRGQQPPPPPPGAGEDDGVDHINSLPAGVLGDIISLLPTTEGARTQAVSRRWRLVWRSAPLNLDLEDLPGGDCDGLCATVARILAGHRGPGRYARIPSCHLHRRPGVVNAWLQSPALENLKELDFCYHRRPRGQEEFEYLPPPPLSTSRFSGSLRVLTLSDCRIPIGIAQALRFPKLEKLGLELVTVSEGSLHSVLAGCPKLVGLLLCRCFGFGRVRISCARLRNLTVNAGYSWPNAVALSEVVIQDAPCLERLIFLDDIHRDIRVSVIAAPKLETLGCLYGYGGTLRAEIGSTVIQGLLRVTDSMTTVCSLKTLAVSFYTLKLDTVIHLMRCFPCLEKLYVKVSPSVDNNLWRRKYRHLIRSLDIRLKTLVLLGYDGKKSQVNFATFFIMNAKMLETVKFVGSVNIENKQFIAKQHMSLQLDKRASFGAQFYFETPRCGNYHNHISHVHDLSITDPFECTC